MKTICTILSLVMAVATVSIIGGCINIKGPEKIEVKSDGDQSSTKEIPYGGSKQEWKKFGKSFANTE